MANASDVQSILNELRGVLSGLTQEEKDRIEQKIENAQKDLAQREEQQAPVQQQAPQQVPVQAPLPVQQPITPPPVQYQPVTPPVQQPLIQPQAAPQEQKQSTQLPWQLQQQQAPVQQQQPPQPAPVQAPQPIQQPITPPPVQSQPVAPPVQQPLIQPQAAPQEQKQSTQLPWQLQQQQAPVQQQQPPQQAPVQAPPPIQQPIAPPPVQAAQPVVEQEDSGIKTINYAILYPAGNENYKDTFINNINEIVLKSIKKKIGLRIIIEKKYDPATANWDEIFKEINMQSLNAMFLLYPRNLNTSPELITSKVNKPGMYFQAIIDAKLNNKITYIDLAIELMLHRK